MGEILKQLQSAKYNTVFASIKAVPSQFKSALDAKINLPQSYKGIKNIVLCGMGGSALGAHILQALNISLVPFYFYNDYLPPRYVNGSTLFIASSYSGNTEEALSSLDEALKRKAKVVGIAAGGALLDILNKKNLPYIKFNDQFNPSGQPRFGLGYALGALLNIFIKLGVAEYKLEYAKNIIFDLAKPSVEAASKLARELEGFAPIIVSGGFLTGNAHVLVNQINETCKVFSEFHNLPELNHHLLEGLKRPLSNKKSLKFLFLESDLYSAKIAARLKITKDVVRRNKIGYSSYQIKGKTELEQVLNFLIFGSLLGLVLSIFYKENPTDIPWVDYFKKQLAPLDNKKKLKTS